jgi:protein translocase SecG subunit
VLGIILTVLYIVSCFVLIMFVLLQPGKSDASQVFGGGVNSAAFGPRGTQTVLAKITITAAICFFMIAFLFSIPGLFDKKSLGQGVGPAESAPAPIVPTTPAEQTAPPSTEPSTQPSWAPGKTPVSNSNKPANVTKPAAGNTNKK